MDLPSGECSADFIHLRHNPCNFGLERSHRVIKDGLVLVLPNPPQCNRKQIVVIAWFVSMAFPRNPVVKPFQKWCSLSPCVSILENFPPNLTCLRAPTQYVLCILSHVSTELALITIS